MPNVKNNWSKASLQDLTRAADLFASIHERTAGNDGFVSPRSVPAYEATGSSAPAIALHKKANRPNIFIKIPGTKEGNLAIEEATTAGVAINVTVLFSREHYVASAEAYMRGLERRVAAGHLLPWPTRVLILVGLFGTVGWWTTALSVRITLPGLILTMAMSLTDLPYTHSHASRSEYTMNRSKCGAVRKSFAIERFHIGKNDLPGHLLQLP